MALIECEDCGKSISDLAEECPHCAYACLDCGEQVKPETAKKCRHCGRPDPLDYWALEEQAEQEEMLLEWQAENRAKLVVWVTAIVFFVGIIWILTKIIG